MEITLFSHILNEELLLPSWLNHHKKLFTHGVILNCRSTDRSVEIIKEICPTWEIIDTDQSMGIDINGIQFLEEKYNGWKMALNVSEYLIIDDLQKYISKLEESGVIGIRATGIILVDRPDDFDLNQFKDPELIKHKDYGYPEKGKAWSGNLSNFIEVTDKCYRSRLLHRNYNGRYLSGRHWTELDVEVDDKLFVSWIGRGSPMLYQYRCKRWSNPPNHFTIWGESGECFSWFDLKHKEYWESENNKSVDIFIEIPLYKQYIDCLYRKMK